MLLIHEHTHTRTLTHTHTYIHTHTLTHTHTRTHTHTHTRAHTHTHIHTHTNTHTHSGHTGDGACVVTGSILTQYTLPIFNVVAARFYSREKHQSKIRQFRSQYYYTSLQLRFQYGYTGLQLLFRYDHFDFSMVIQVYNCYLDMTNSISVWLYKSIIAI